jgi:asparagine synthase (glutamine-hydrolysing)
MAAQFGRWNINGCAIDPDYLQKAGVMIAPYGPDGGELYVKDTVGIAYRSFHTTKESRRETQPYATAAGAVITWDGRLDNRAELLGELRERLAPHAADVVIVAAAYDAWGTQSFGRLMGDWALSIWDPKSQSVILAKDPIGTRSLYYSSDKDQVTWSTVLDPLVLLSGKGFTLEEEYIAGWLSYFPATHLTPYAGLLAVPASCFVRLEPGRQAVRKYWDFDSGKKIRYRSDAEYEEHFRSVFGEGVRRRLRAESPVLAELSGGMDSTSIVCMADAILSRGGGEFSRLDTLSYYDDSEPNWNERTYFAKVEEKRGRIGWHIDVGAAEGPRFGFANSRFTATPGSGRPLNEASRKFSSCLATNGYRVVLSGVGGDEVTGGVPTPTPELENLLARAKFAALAHQLKVWALSKRKPWFYLFFEATKGFCPPSLVALGNSRRPAPWLAPAFMGRNREALRGYRRRLKLIGPLPSFQENISTLDTLRRQLACVPPTAEPLYEKRYPFLDRDLLEFVYAIPREQLVRPGQRRALVRRALSGIVPDEVLNRKRKASVAHAPMEAISRGWPELLEMTQNMECSRLGIVDSSIFRKTLEKAREGREIALVWVLRTIYLESWLRKLSGSGLVAKRPQNKETYSVATRQWISQPEKF